MASVVVKVDPAVVPALLAALRTGGGIGPVLGLEREPELVLTPMHPGVDDDELRSWFSGTSESSAAELDRMLASLRRSAVVAAAYWKPEAEPPGSNGV